MRRRLEKYPGDFSANYTLGDVLLNRGDAAGAIPYFETAIKADPANVMGATELGVAFFTASRLPEAEQQFQRALKLDPGYSDARFDLASVEAAEQKYEAAAADFQQVLQVRPDHAKAKQHLGEVLLLWGNSYFDTGKDQEAVARYRDALVFRPEMRNCTDGWGWRWRGWDSWRRRRRTGGVPQDRSYAGAGQAGVGVCDAEEVGALGQGSIGRVPLGCRPACPTKTSSSVCWNCRSWSWA